MIPAHNSDAASVNVERTSSATSLTPEISVPAGAAGAADKMACNGPIWLYSLHISIYLAISRYISPYLPYPAISGTDFAKRIVQGRD